MAIPNNLFIAFESRQHNDLRLMAANPAIDFSATFPDMRNIFHRCVDENAIKSLTAILKGYIEGNRMNKSITVALNSECQEKTPLCMAEQGNRRTYYKGTERRIVELFLALGADRQRLSSSSAIANNPVSPGAQIALTRDLKECLLNGELEEVLIRLHHVSFDPVAGGVPAIKNLKDGLDNALLIAIKKGKSEDLIVDIINAFQIRGDDIKYSNKNGETIFLLAVQKGYKKVVNYLIENNHVDWMPRISDGFTIMHYAAQCEKDKIEILELLIQKNPQLVHSRTLTGQTPLHLVRCVEAVDVLCIQGLADPNAKDLLGGTPQQITGFRSAMICDRIKLYDPSIDNEQKMEIIYLYNWYEALKHISYKIFTAATEITGSALTEGLRLALAALVTFAIFSLQEGLKTKKRR